MEIFPKKCSLVVEVADTPYKQAEGLMFRKELISNRGMVFTYKKPQKLSFWGFNTYIPLDIAYVSGDKIVKIGHIKPHCTKGVLSDVECDFAVEANMDYFSDNEVHVGDTVEIVKTEYGSRVDFY